MLYGVEFEHSYFEKVKRMQVWAVLRLYLSIYEESLRKTTVNIKIEIRYVVQ